MSHGVYINKRIIMYNKKHKFILGVALSHNGAACIMCDGKIVASISEERLTRCKRQWLHPGQPSLAVNYCLREAGIGFGDLTAVAYTSPERLTLRKARVHNAKQHRVPVYLFPHHLSHAAYAFGTSGFKKASVFVVDGMGSPWEDWTAQEKAMSCSFGPNWWEWLSFYEGDETGLRSVFKLAVKDGKWMSRSSSGGMQYFGSLGGMYSAVADYLFKDPFEAGKVMGLAAYGKSKFKPDDFCKYKNDIFEFNEKIPHLFREPFVLKKDFKAGAALAASVQHALEEGIMAVLSNAQGKAKSDRLCYSGGVALNGLVNERIIRSNLFKDVYITPAADDSGTSVGAAILATAVLAGIFPNQRLASDSLGRKYSETEVVEFASKISLVKCRPLKNTVKWSAKKLAQGLYLGWFQSGSEFGPRALGYRSILCNPQNKQAKLHLNEKIKGREIFRPFAPVLKLEDAATILELDGVKSESRFMLRVLPFKDRAKKQIPAVVHVDGTGRPQTLSANDGLFYKLLHEFKSITGIPALLNTSFNLAQEPIVETPQDAIWTFLESGLDLLIMENFVIERTGGGTDILNLRPRIVAFAPTAASNFRMGRSKHPDFLFLEVATPWGNIIRRYPKVIAKRIFHFDGKKTGYEILEDIFGTSIKASNVRKFIRFMFGLRRAGVISFEAM
jgi:carbamoyltransferase